MPRKPRSSVMSKELVTLKKKVDKLENDEEEQHYNDGTPVVGITGVDYNGVILPLTNTISEGDTEVNRQGINIFLKYIDLNVQFYPLAGSTTPQVVRLVVFLDKMNNNAAILPTALWSPTASTMATVAACQSPYHWPNVPSRFAILLDKTFVVSNTANGDNLVTFKKRVKVNRKVYYTGTTGSTYYKNSAFLGLLSNQSAVTQPGYTYIARCVFNE